MGPTHQVPTIDVATQDSGPRLTLRQLAAYLRQQQQQQQEQKEQQQASRQQGRQERQPQRLLNVVSLSLAGTPLEVRPAVSSQAVCLPACLLGWGWRAALRRLSRSAGAWPEPICLPPPLPPPLQDSVVPPAAVQQLDLVSAVWPDVASDGEDATEAAGAGAGGGGGSAREEQRPETLLYALLGEWPGLDCWLAGLA